MGAFESVRDQPLGALGVRDAMVKLRDLRLGQRTPGPAPPAEAIGIDRLAAGASRALGDSAPSSPVVNRSCSAVLTAHDCPLDSTTTRCGCGATSSQRRPPTASEQVVTPLDGRQGPTP